MIALVAALCSAAIVPVGAQASVTVLEDSHRVNFPDNITFTLRVQAPSEITRIRIEYFYATGITRATGNPTFERGTTTTATFELRTGGQSF
ncbi:MAG: hypothetical protein NZ518_05560, partial [Dehalococcoidia bacterium]|nr:hypothetical protein [Dehalococcoidia bacterium]